MRLLGFLSVVIIALSALLVGARALGTQGTTAIAEFATETCSPQPCWHSIRPGVTSLADTRNILQADAISGTTDEYKHCYQLQGCWSISITSYSADPADPIGQMAFVPAPGSFLLGDAVRVYGDPLTSQVCLILSPSAGDVGPEVPRPLMVSYITFRGNIKAIAYNSKALTDQRFDPAMDIYRMYYQIGSDIYTPRWRGFLHPALGCRQK